MAISLTNPFGRRFVNGQPATSEVQQHPMDAGYDSSGINPRMSPAAPSPYPQEYQNGGGGGPMGAFGTGPMGPMPPRDPMAQHAPGLPTMGDPRGMGVNVPAGGTTAAGGPLQPPRVVGSTKPTPGGGPLTQTGPSLGNPNAFDINSILQSLWASTGGAGPQTNPADLANQYMSQLLSQDSPYIRDARMRSMQMAAGRGLTNSSIAAGAGESAAINAAQPMFQAAYGLNQQRENNTFQGALDRFNQGMGLLSQREQNAFTGQQHSMDLSWQGQQAQLDRDLKSKLQSDAAFQQNWLSNQDFSRQFNAALAMMPINTANQFMQTIQQYAIENPEIYTPEMISGMQNFFTQSMAALLQQYFPSLGTQPTGTGG